MVMKHPFIFIDADVVVINKADLAQAMKVDVRQLERDVNRRNPNAKVAVTNCRTGEGVRDVVEALNL
jgi:hydrogenase nickel incorporation protein HypB